MNKLLKVLAASALVATVLVGCGPKDEPTTEAAKYAKVGLGVVSSFADGQVNSTIAAVGLDGEGKVQYCYLDVAQSKPADADAKTKTKKMLKEEYGMKGVSAKMGVIEGGAEWYEQAEALEKFVVGKTADEIAAIKTEARDEQHPSVPADADLKAGCTMNIGEFKDAIAKAITNAKDAASDKIGVGIEMEPNAASAQLNTTISVVATDKDGKVVASEIEVAQISESNPEKTKSELKEEYGMKGVSAKMGVIKDGAEWYEQADFLEKYIVGKTASEIDAIKTEARDEQHPSVPAEEDLKAGCTMNIGSFKTTIAEAMK